MKITFRKYRIGYTGNGVQAILRLCLSAVASLRLRVKHCAHILLLCLFASVSPSFAQGPAFPVREMSDKLYASLLTGTSADVINVENDQWTNMMSYTSTFPNTVKYKANHTIVRVAIDHGATVIPSAPYTYKIVYALSGAPSMTSSSLSFTATDTLLIGYNPDSLGAYQDEQVRTYPNLYKAKVEIVGVYDVTSGTPVSLGLPSPNTNFYIELAMRYQPYLKTHNIPADMALNTSHSYDATHQVLDVSWTPSITPLFLDKVTPAQYELEWTYIDNYAPDGSDLSLSSLEYNFRNNATRILTDSLHYGISVSYPKGYILYRVRMVRVDDASYKYPIYGVWSLSDVSGDMSSLSSSDYYEISTPHSGDSLNWNYTIHYAEGGKYKHVMSYFDGMLKNRQTITRFNTNPGKLLAAEQLYDFEGRAAITTLPAVINTTSFRYQKGVSISSVTGLPYQASDFDLRPVTCPDNVIIPPFADTSWANRYYSPLNTDTAGLQKFVPQAEGYPFVHTQLSAGFADRVEAAGGAGPVLQVNNGHDTRMEYMQAEQPELNSYFGINAGRSSFYNKTVVTDPNGQNMTTVKDYKGRQVLSSLVGVGVDTSTIAIILNEEVPPAKKYKENKLDSATNRVTDKSHKVYSGSFYMDFEGMSNIRYEYDYKPFKVCPAPAYRGLTVKCSYEYDLHDNCGVEILYRTGVLGLTGVVTDSTSTPFDEDTTLFLDKGKYTLNKTLTIAVEDVEAAVDSFMSYKPNCVRTEEDFVREEIERTTYPCPAEDECSKLKKELMEELFTDAKYGKWRPGGGIVVIGGSDDPDTNSIYDIPQYVDSPGVAKYRFQDTCVIAALNALVITKGGKTYKNIGGIPLKVYDSTGKLTSYFTENEIVTFFKDEIYTGTDRYTIAEVLLPLHPEYCKLLGCFVDTLAERLKAMPDAAAAIKYGLFYLNDIVDRDDQLRAKMLASPFSYTHIDDSLRLMMGGNIRMDTMASKLAFCMTGDGMVYGDANDFFRSKILALDFPNTKVKNDYFSKIRDFYLFNRAKYVSMAKTGAPSGCQPCDTARMKLIPQPRIVVPYTAEGGFSMGPDGFLSMFSDSALAPIRKLLDDTRYMPGDTTGAAAMADSAWRHNYRIDTILCRVAIDSIMSRLANCWPTSGTGTRLRDSLESLVSRGLVHNGKFLPEQVREAIVSAGYSLSDLCHPYLLNYDYYLEGLGNKGHCYAPSFYTAVKDFFNEPDINNPLKSITSSSMSVSTPASWPSVNPFAAQVSAAITGGTGSIQYGVQYLSADSLYVCSFFKTGSDTVKVSLRSPRKIRRSSTVIPFLNVTSGDSISFRKVQCFQENGTLSADGYISSFMFFADVDRIDDSSGYTVSNKGQFLGWNNGKVMMNEDGTNQISSCVPCTQFREYFTDFADSLQHVFGGFAEDHPLFYVSLRNYMNYRLKKVYGEDQYRRFLESCALADSMRIPMYGGYAHMSFPTPGGIPYSTFAAWQAAVATNTGLYAHPAVEYKIGSTQYVIIDYTGIPKSKVRTLNEKVIASGGSAGYMPPATALTLWIPDTINIAPFLLGTPFWVSSSSSVKVKLDPSVSDEYDYALYTLADSATLFSFSRISRGIRDLQLKLYDSGLVAFWMPNHFSTIGRDYYKAEKQALLRYTYSMQGLPAGKVLDTLQHFVLESEVSAFSGSQLSYANPKNKYRFTDLYYTPASSHFPGYDTVENVLAAAQAGLGTGSIFLPSGTSKQTISGTAGSGGNLNIYRCADGLYWYRYFDAGSRIFNIYIRVPAYVYKSSHASFQLVDLLPAIGDTAASSFTARITIPGSGDTIAASGTADFNLSWTLKLRDVLLGNESNYAKSKEEPLSGEQGSHPNCEQLLLRRDTYAGKINYLNYITKYREDLIASFGAHVMENVRENLWVEYMEQRFGTTLYAYDRANNLIRTVPPEGVRRLDTPVLSSVDSLRAANARVLAAMPQHKKVTTYEYNTANQPWKEVTPDAGIKILYYDKKGNVLLSQKETQRWKGMYFTYFLYDAQNRLTETGEVEWTVDCPFFDPIPMTTIEYGQPVPVLQPFPCACANLEDSLWEYCGPFLKMDFYDNADFNAQIRAKKRTQVVYTVYDSAFRKLETLGVPNLTAQENLRSRIAASMYYLLCKPGLPAGNFDHAMHYSYDAMGNVSTLTREFPQLEGVKQRYKRIDYEYDLWSGKTNMISYNRGLNDQFYQRYDYDADNRITKVETSRDGFIWRRDAGYTYYDHGPLARISLGDNRIQGVDYAYTLQGWLKAINGDISDTTADMGEDGKRNTIVPRDVYATTLDYFTGDYKPIGSTQASRVVPHGRNLYNGNIARQSTDVLPFGGLTTSYTYDQMNRIRDARYAQTLRDTALSYLNKYASTYKYDMDGNFRLLTRQDSAGITMDSLEYRFPPWVTNNNQIAQIEDYSPYSVSGVEDIKQGARLVHYDMDGNMGIDNGSNIEKIEWNIYGKADLIHRMFPTKGGDKGLLWFGYDAQGQRTYKYEKTRTMIDSGELLTLSTYYVRDVSGNILAEYNMRKQYVEGGYVKVYPALRSGMTGSVGAIKATWLHALDTFGYLLHPDFAEFVIARCGVIPSHPVGYYLAGDPALTYAFVSGGFGAVRAMCDYSTATGNYPLADALRRKMILNGHNTPLITLTDALLTQPDADMRAHAIVQLMQEVPDLYADLAAQHQITLLTDVDSANLFALIDQDAVNNPGSFRTKLASYFVQDNTILDGWMRAFTSDTLYATDPWYSTQGFKTLLEDALTGHADAVAHNTAIANGTDKSEEGIYAFADWWGGSSSVLETIAPSEVALDAIEYYDDPFTFLTGLSGYDLIDTALSLIDADVVGMIHHFTGTGTSTLSSQYTYVPQDPVITMQHISLASHHIYGSSRIGIHNYWPTQFRNFWDFKDVKADTSLNLKKPWFSFAANDVIDPGTTDAWGHSLVHSSTSAHFIGLRRYELNNQVGNVQAVLSDKPFVKTDGYGIRDYFNAALPAAYDYYPYGMFMPGRTTADTGEYCFTTSEPVKYSVRTPVPVDLSNAVPLQSATLSGSSPGVLASGTAGGLALDIPVIPGETISITPNFGYLSAFVKVTISEAGIGTTRKLLASRNITYLSPPVTMTVTPSRDTIRFEAIIASPFLAPPLFGLFRLDELLVDSVANYYQGTLVQICNKMEDRYEFGFNAQMKDNDVAGLGNWQDFGTRMHNTRTGMMPSRDPYTACTPWASPYSFAGNNPISFMDKNGEFKVDANIKSGYPNVYAYLRDQFETDMNNSADIYRVLQYRTNAKREDIARDFKDGSGVALIAETSPAYMEKSIPSDAPEFYSDKYERIEMNTKVLEYVENILKEPASTQMNKQQALLLLNIVLLHSESHNLEENFGPNIKNLGNSPGYPVNTDDPGYDIEYMLYGLKRRPENEPGKSDISGVRSQNYKLVTDIREKIIQSSKGDSRKESNLPSVPGGEKEIGGPGTGSVTR